MNHIYVIMIRLIDIIFESLSDDPIKWEELNKKWNKAYIEKADTVKMFGEYTLAFFKNKHDSNVYDIIAYNKDMVVIGNLFFGKNDPTDETITGAIEIHPLYRRRKLATMMYIWAEKLTNLKFKPESSHTDDAEKFWGQKNRMFGNNV